MEKYVIIVAGGSGTRMKSDVPKQFMLLAGKPILVRTIERFREAIPQIKIILVLPATLKEEWNSLCKKYALANPFQIVDGGETRFHSVKSGLAVVPADCVVGVHDAARPLVSIKTIRTTFETAEKTGNASPAIPLTESIRMLNENGNKAIDRKSVNIIQTPQCFLSSLLKKAFLQNYSELFTDDASVLEAMGEKINLIEGNPENIKITNPQDMLIAEALLRNL